MINLTKINMKDVTRIELTEVCPKAAFDISRVEPSGSAKSEVVKFLQVHASQQLLMFFSVYNYDNKEVVPKSVKTASGVVTSRSCWMHRLAHPLSQDTASPTHCSCINIKTKLRVQWQLLSRSE